MIVMVTLCPLSKKKEEQMIAVLISPDGPLQPVVFLFEKILRLAWMMGMRMMLMKRVRR